MVNDLQDAVKKSITAGDQVIIMLDANEDIRDGYLQKKLEETGLREANRYHHGEDAPATYNRGSKPIDGMFITPSLLDAVQCGYLAFGDAPGVGDHRVLWLDIPASILFGNNLKPTTYQARRLKCNDPA